MSEESRSVAISVLSVAVGFAVAAGVSFLQNRTELQSYRATESQFQQLSAMQQKQLMYLADRFADRSEEEQQQLRELHEAVSADPALQNKLTAFHAWWETLDREQQAQLKEDGRFREDWPAEVARIYQQHLAAKDEILVRSMWGGRTIRARFSESEFECFLGKVLPKPLPDSLQSEIDSFDSSQVCERTLTQTLWMIENSETMIAESGGHPSKLADRLKSAAQTCFSKFARDVAESDGRGRIELSTVFMCLRAAIEHYDDRLSDKRVVAEPGNYVSAYEQLEDDDQLEVLKLAVGTAAKLLRNQELARDQSPEIARLGERLSKYRRQFADLARRLFVPRGPGGPGRFGQGGGDRGPGGGRNGRGGPGQGNGRRPPGEDRQNHQDSGRRPRPDGD